MNYVSFVDKSKDELIIKKDDTIINMYIVIKGKIKLSAYPP
jgi:hypothetical protein